MPHTLDHLRYEASIIEELISPKSIPIGTINPGRVTYINFLFAEYARFTEDTIENDLAINHQQNGYQTLSWQNLLKFTIPLAFIALLIYFYQHRLKDQFETAETLPPPKLNTNIKGLLSREEVEERLQEQFQRHQLNRNTLGVVLIELDRLSQISAQFGDGMANEILNKVCHYCQTHIRQNDSLGYWDNHVFLLLLPNSDLKQITELMQRLQQGINNLDFSIKHKQTTTIGVACMSIESIAGELTEKAYIALQAAKTSGHNQIKVYGV